MDSTITFGLDLDWRVPLGLIVYGMGVVMLKAVFLVLKICAFAHFLVLQGSAGKFSNSFHSANVLVMPMNVLISFVISFIITQFDLCWLDDINLGYILSEFMNWAYILYKSYPSVQ